VIVSDSTFLSSLWSMRQLINKPVQCFQRSFPSPLSLTPGPCLCDVEWRDNTRHCIVWYQWVHQRIWPIRNSAPHVIEKPRRDFPQNVVYPDDEARGHADRRKSRQTSEMLSLIFLNIHREYNSFFIIHNSYTPSLFLNDSRYCTMTYVHYSGFPEECQALFL
jgi:hypothetical protein